VPFVQLLAVLTSSLPEQVLPVPVLLVRVLRPVPEQERPLAQQRVRQVPPLQAPPPAWLQPVRHQRFHGIPTCRP
jgi:hypothetical protein